MDTSNGLSRVAYIVTLSIPNQGIEKKCIFFKDSNEFRNAAIHYYKNYCEEYFTIYSSVSYWKRNCSYIFLPNALIDNYDFTHSESDIIKKSNLKCKYIFSKMPMRDLVSSMKRIIEDINIQKHIIENAINSNKSKIYGDQRSFNIQPTLSSMPVEEYYKIMKNVRKFYNVNSMSWNYIEIII